MSTKSLTSLTSKDLVTELTSELGDSQIFINHSIADFVSTKLGGVAKVICIVRDTQQLVSVCKTAIKFSQAYQVIGLGTGSLASEVGFEGIIIVNQSNSLFFTEGSQLVVDSGVLNDVLVLATANKGLSGLEFLIDVPGTVGGAIATSATFDSKSIRSRVLKELVVFTPKVDGGEITTIAGDQIPNRPFEPIWKESTGFHQVILTAKLQLARLTQPEILSKINNYRDRRNNKYPSNRLGYFFNPPIQELPDNHVFPSLPKGLKYSKKTPNLIDWQQNQSVQPSQIRVYIEKLAESLNQTGMSLESRLSYLGYWPENEETRNPNA